MSGIPDYAQPLVGWRTWGVGQYGHLVSLKGLADALTKPVYSRRRFAHRYHLWRSYWKAAGNRWERYAKESACRIHGTFSFTQATSMREVVEMFNRVFRHPNG